VRGGVRHIIVGWDDARSSKPKNHEKKREEARVTQEALEGPSRPKGVSLWLYLRFFLGGINFQFRKR